MTRGGPGVFGPFRGREFSLQFSSQVISHTGTWFQNLALSLVVLQVTGSAQALSGVTVAQFLPLLLLSIPAGRLADRMRPRTIMLIAAPASAAIVGGLAVVTMSSEPELWRIYLLVAALGTVSTFDRIAGQTIIYEIAGPESLARAVSLSTIAQASARSIGPGLAGIAFQGLGATACMLVNSGSFMLVFVAVLLIRPSRLLSRAPRGPIAAGSAPIRRNRPLVTALIVNAVVALLAFNLLIVLTATVTLDFEADATGVGLVHAMNAVGAIGGGILAAGRMAMTGRTLALACVGFGAALLLNAAAPTLLLFVCAGPVLGVGIGYYQGVLQATVQSSAAPEQLGRTISLMTLGHYGMVPIGALLIGWIIDASSGRTALMVGGIAALGCAAFVAIMLGTRRDGVGPAQAAG